LAFASLLSSGCYRQPSQHSACCLFGVVVQNSSDSLACGEDLCASCEDTYCDLFVKDSCHGPVDVGVSLGEDHLDADGRSHFQRLHLLLFRLFSQSERDPCQI